VTTENSGRDENLEVAEIALLARRAGLKVSASDLVDLTGPYRRTRDGLRALRASLDPTDEPAHTFEAGTRGAQHSSKEDKLEKYA
jgi:hypothetical protein